MCRLILRLVVRKTGCVCPSMRTSDKLLAWMDCRSPSFDENGYRPLFTSALGFRSASAAEPAVSQWAPPPSGFRQRRQ